MLIPPGFRQKVKMSAVKKAIQLLDHVSARCSSLVKSMRRSLWTNTAGIQDLQKLQETAGANENELTPGRGKEDSLCDLVL